LVSPRRSRGDSRGSPLRYVKTYISNDTLDRVDGVCNGAPTRCTRAASTIVDDDVTEAVIARHGIKKFFHDVAIQIVRRNFRPSRRRDSSHPYELREMNRSTRRRCERTQVACRDGRSTDCVAHRRRHAAMTRAMHPLRISIRRSTTTDPRSPTR
jgi:hypothetical protein